MPKHILSKSTFIRGVQCHKSLYLHKFHPGLRDPLPALQRARFERGHNVGDLARSLFPGGADARPAAAFQSQQGLENTQKLISGGRTVIYEAYFQYQNVLAIMDILVKDEEGWKAYEVKSSAEIKEVYRLDAALQYFVITGSGLPLADISIIHVDTSYVREGDLDIKKLFTSESVLANVLGRQEFIKNEVLRQLQLLNVKRMPETNIGPHCSDPYDCDFRGYCWKDVPEYSVFDIAALSQEKKFELYHMGIHTPERMPDGYELTASQRQQVDCEVRQSEVIDVEAIRDFLATVSYPLYFVDFESFQPAVPMFDHSRPYQQLVFQFSSFYLHDAGSPPVHREFLAVADGDPRIPFIRDFLDATSLPGHILVYNISFERGRLQELARDFPAYASGLEERISRLEDLMPVFQKRHWYKPAMRGSYSIKAVYPALFPGEGWEKLAISEGGMASLAFEKLYSETDPRQVSKTRKELLKYCRLDTWSMLVIYQALEQRIRK